MSGRGFASAALDGSQHPRGEGQEQPGAGGDAFEATTPPQSFLDQIVTAWQTPQDELGEQLVRRTLRNWENSDHGPVLQAVLQIAGNEPAAREKLRAIIQRSMMGPSAQALDESERLARSGLIASQLMGLAFMRYIWKIEPIATMTEDDLVAAIAPTIQRYLDGNIGPAAQPQGHPTRQA